MFDFPPEVTVESWSELVAHLQRLQDCVEQRQSEKPDLYIPNLLYRGHADSSWRLATTLERSSLGADNVSTYYDLAAELHHQFASFYEIPFEPLAAKKVDEWATPGHAPIAPPAYEYLAYLRHHGFPSPLLDWTKSPFVAAYFALREFERNADFVAIFAFWDHSGHGKSGWSRDPRIWRLGPNIRTHHRHFRQQSEYTVCLGEYDVGDAEKPSRAWRFGIHDDVITATRSSRKSATQDQLVKFLLPSNERKVALDYLRRHNIDEHTLFGTEEELARKAWLERAQFASSAPKQLESAARQTLRP